MLNIIPMRLVLLVFTSSIMLTMSNAQDKPVGGINTSNPDSSTACGDVVKQIINAKSSGEKTAIENGILNMNAPSCFIEANTQFQDTAHVLGPVRVSLLNAVDSMSASQQQGSSLSSTGSANAVTKPSGPTALIEEFGGANVTSSTSSLTAQWSPGTLLRNMALTGAVPLCLQIEPRIPGHCISENTIKAWAPLTVKITGNTSGAASTAKGSATTPTSSSPSQQVTVNSQGGNGMGLGGVTIQYSFGPAGKITQTAKNSNATFSADELQLVPDELDAAHDVNLALSQCPGYAAWRTQAKSKFEVQLKSINGAVSQQDIQSLQSFITAEYHDLLERLLASSACKSVVPSVNTLYSTILKAMAQQDISASNGSGNTKPEIALEYDLNTPQNKPSYSSAKISANLSFGPKQPASKKAKTGSTTPLDQFVSTQAIIDSAPNSGTTEKSKQTASNAKSVAAASTKPFSLTLDGTADIYNSEPPSSVPSASHLRDIQAGAELSWLFNRNAQGPFAKLIGPFSIAGAYSYQDQTSPAILTGPALNDFTGLPSSTTSAYAKRGVIHLGQLKFGMGTGSTISYPLAFTYSNRTELVLHPTWGVQFGVSYNLSSLFGSSSSTPSSPNQAGGK